MQLQGARRLKLATTIVGFSTFASFASFPLALELLSSMPVCVYPTYHPRWGNGRKSPRWASLGVLRVFPAIRGFVPTHSHITQILSFTLETFIGRSIDPPLHVWSIPARLGGDAAHLTVIHWLSPRTAVHENISQLPSAFSTHDFSTRVGLGWYISGYRQNEVMVVGHLDMESCFDIHWWR